MVTYLADNADDENETLLHHCPTSISKMLELLQLFFKLRGDM